MDNLQVNSIFFTSYALECAFYVINKIKSNVQIGLKRGLVEFKYRKQSFFLPKSNLKRHQPIVLGPGEFESTRTVGDYSMVKQFLEHFRDQKFKCI